MINKEAIYDEQIAPLMTEIIRICKENDLPAFAFFELTDGEENEDEGPLFCTTAIPTEWDSGMVDRLREVAKPEPVFATITTITKQNG